MNLYKPSTSHSRKFCAPPGTCFIFLVASCAKMIRPSATTQLTTIELVIGKLKGRAISTAFGDKPCSCGSDGVPGRSASVGMDGVTCAVTFAANVGALVTPTKRAMRIRRSDKAVEKETRTGQPLEDKHLAGRFRRGGAAACCMNNTSMRLAPRPKARACIRNRTLPKVTVRLSALESSECSGVLRPDAKLLIGHLGPKLFTLSEQWRSRTIRGTARTKYPSWLKKLL